VKDHTGDPRFPVWLVADSEPRNWHHLLSAPLDPRHPARHNIWTPVLDYVQDTLYRKEKRRFDTTNLYIRNAVINSDDKPQSTALSWSQELQKEIHSLSTSLLNFKPRVVLTFGAFAFEFLRRAHGEKPMLPYSHWSTRQLGGEFKNRIASYEASKTNILPLLHVSIARGKFLESHKYFVGEESMEPANYFEFVGNKLAQLFLRELRNAPIWIK